MLSQQVTEALLYYYKMYILQCKRENAPLYIKPQSFYYLQPFLIYLYSLSFTHQSFLFTLLFLELFYSLGKSGDLVNKSAMITYSNDITSYKVMKFFNHSALHMIFYLKLFYYSSNSNDPTYKWLLFGALQLFQLGMYIHKSYRRRYDFIQQYKLKEDGQKGDQKDQLITYPSYYKIPIVTSNERDIVRILQSTSYFTSENYYTYILGFVHFFIYYFL